MTTSGREAPLRRNPRRPEVRHEEEARARQGTLAFRLCVAGGVTGGLHFRCRERIGGERERAAAREKNRDRPTREHTTSSSVSKKPHLDQIPAANLDADDPLTDEDNEDFEEESDGDDTVALLAELEKIKKERAEKQARKEQEQKAEEERIRMENILSGNPLLNLTGPSQPQANFKVKKKWVDDVVFKNCAKGIDDQKKDKRFVNDTLRSEFHKKFMEKYIK
ncbi:hypothetical protein ACRRTK_002475 [Alexandromys fortis]